MPAKSLAVTEARLEGLHLGPIGASYRAQGRRVNERDIIDRRRPGCRHRLIELASAICWKNMG
jgi:hypothetical protein